MVGVGVDADGRTVRRLYTVRGVGDVPPAQRRSATGVRGSHLPNGITRCIWELLSDVILAVCTCVAFKYNQVKQKYVVFEKWDDG